MAAIVMADMNGCLMKKVVHH